MTDLNAPAVHRQATPPPAARGTGAPATGAKAAAKARTQTPAKAAATKAVGKSAGKPPVTGGPAGSVHLDTISKLIIEQLQQDGRRSYAAIGKAVGLSEAAVRQRVQRLLEMGVMQIVAVTDPLMLGFQRQVMIAIKCDGDLVAVADHLAEMEETDYVVVTAGSFDILVELVCESDEQLLELLGRVRAVPTVTSTETFVYLKLRKQTYSWGTR
jgi:Lrp/AsnC family transcriptional regulator for asnA, asnC and gidA